MTAAIVAASLLLGVAPAADPADSTGAAEPEGAALYGPGYHFVLTMPVGWHAEFTGDSLGRVAHIVPEIDSTGSVPAYVYVIVDPKPVPGPIDFRRVARESVENLQQRYGGVTVTQDSDIVTLDGIPALLYRFRREMTGEREAWGMIESDSVVIRIGYIAREEAGFRPSYDTFREIVRSYRFSKVPYRVRWSIPDSGRDSATE